MLGSLSIESLLGQTEVSRETWLRKKKVVEQ